MITIYPAKVELTALITSMLVMADIPFEHVENHVIKIPLHVPAIDLHRVLAGGGVTLTASYDDHTQLYACRHVLVGPSDEHSC